MADYEVKKGMFGHKVLYSCPACGTPLTSALDLAGTKDSCPDCTRQHVIPGVAEKAQLEKAAASKQQKVDEDAKRRIATKAAAAKASAAKATPNVTTTTNGASRAPSVANYLASSPAMTGNPPAPATAKRRYRFGDNILDWAFTVARIFSTVVIVVATIVLLIIGLQFGSTYTSQKSLEPGKIKVPTVEEFKTHLAQTPAVAGDTNGDADRGSSPLSSGSQADSPVVAVLKKHKMQNHASYRYLLEEIRTIERELDSNEFAEFISTLDGLLLANQDNKYKAADWVCTHYTIHISIRNREVDRNRMQNAERSLKMASLVTAAGGVFGSLICFMILPLLIRIEANTR